MLIDLMRVSQEPSTKKRKTEWEAGLRKLEGDTALVQAPWNEVSPITRQEILTYLQRFHDQSEHAMNRGEAVHPLDFVMDAFKTPELAKVTVDRMKAFLQEVLLLHQKPFQVASVPVAWTRLACQARKL